MYNYPVLFRSSQQPSCPVPRHSSATRKCSCSRGHLDAHSLPSTPPRLSTRRSGDAVSRVTPARHRSECAVAASLVPPTEKTAAVSRGRISTHSCSTQDVFTCRMCSSASPSIVQQRPLSSLRSSSRVNPRVRLTDSDSVGPIALPCQNRRVTSSSVTSSGAISTSDDAAAISPEARARSSTRKAAFLHTDASSSTPTSRTSPRFLRFWRKRRSEAPLLRFSECGFENLGNTCYMNSALQCLIATQLFSDYFYSGMYLHDLRTDNALGSGGALAKAFASLVKQYKERPTSAPLNLMFMKNVVAQFNPMFSGFDQHDAQEFLAVFLDGVHEDLNRAAAPSSRRRVPAPEDPTIDCRALTETRYERLAAQAWQRYLCRNKSFLVDLFQGQLESRITCLHCNDFSLKFEPFMYLSLPLKPATRENRRIRTLEDALIAFSYPEQLTDAQWKCPKCRLRVPVTKRIQIIKLPPVLIIHLKRFEFADHGSRKLEDYIDVFLHGVNMQRLVNQKHAPIYDLYAVIDHTGHALSGHYTASCLRDGEWYRFDDALVYPIELDQVITEATYLLFYLRRDVPSKPNLLQRQTLRHPEHWPHSLRSESIEHMRHTGRFCLSCNSDGPSSSASM